MNYGLQMSASGVLTSMFRQDVLSNNLANLDTIGFKPDFPATRARDAAAVEDGLTLLPSNRLLERLGAGALLAPNRTSTTQGSTFATGNPLHAAIHGEGFFVVSQRPGDAGVRLTRNGQFVVSPRGELVTADSGLPVLNPEGHPIVIDRDAGAVRLERDGALTRDGVVVARVALMSVPGADTLEKTGHSLLRPSGTQRAAMRPATGWLEPAALERSAVDPIAALMSITSATNSVTMNAKMIQMQDEMMGRAIAGLARVV